TFFLLLLLSSCVKDKEAESSLFDKNYTDSTANLTASNYSINCYKVNDQNRLALRTELPNHIYDIFSTYKGALEELEKKKIYATSNSQYTSYVKAIQMNVRDSLLI